VEGDLPLKPVWKEHVYPLRYQFGDRTLFSRRLRLLVWQLSLDDGIRQGEGWRCLTEALPQGFDGFMIRCLPYAGCAEMLRRDGAYIEYVLARQPRYYLPLTGQFESYVLSRFSAKTRSTMQRKIRKWAERSGGQISWKAYRTPVELRCFHPLARQISSATYQERLFDAGLPNDEPFLTRMVQEAGADRVRAFLLFDGDKPVAFLYLSSDGDTLLYSYLGFLPDYRSWSVGTILQWFALEYLFSEQRFRLFDFTEGDGEHKRFFATENLEVANVIFLRRSLANEVLLRGHRTMNRVSRGAGRALERWGLKAYARRLVRYGVSALWQKSS